MTIEAAVPQPIRVLLADDQTLLRGTFRLLVEATSDMEVVAEAGSGHQAVDQARALRPDIVLMDIRMPDLDGVEATALICADPELVGTRVIILTTFETEENVLDALQAGASAFLGKGIDPASLLDAIRVVMSGEALLSPRVTRAVISRVLSQPGRPDTSLQDMLDQLTPREREILVLVGLGMSNSEIATELFISTMTAKTHINRAMTKLNARDRAQLVIIAYETGLVIAGNKLRRIDAE